MAVAARCCCCMLPPQPVPPGHHLTTTSYHQFTTNLPQFYHNFNHKFTTSLQPTYHNFTTNFTTNLPPVYHQLTTILPPIYYQLTTNLPPILPPTFQQFNHHHLPPPPPTTTSTTTSSSIRACACGPMLTRHWAGWAGALSSAASRHTGGSCLLCRACLAHPALLTQPWPWSGRQHCTAAGGAGLSWLAFRHNAVLPCPPVACPAPPWPGQPSHGLPCPARGLACPAVACPVMECWSYVGQARLPCLALPCPPSVVMPQQLWRP